MKSIINLALGCLVLTACGGGGGGGGATQEPPVIPPTLPAAQPPTVQISVQASDKNGIPLTYDWKVSEGNVANPDSTATDLNTATINWTLPAGAGVHFAYVHVFNKKGGHTIRRIAVITDDIGSPVKSTTPANFDAPVAAAATGNFFQALLRLQSNYYCDVSKNNCVAVYLPDAVERLTRVGATTSTIPATSNLRGYFTIPDVPAGEYVEECASDNAAAYSDCTNTNYFSVALNGNALAMGSPYTIDEAVSNYYHAAGLNDRSDYIGHVVLEDGSPCGMYDEFFGLSSVAQATVYDVNGNVIDKTRNANIWGHYGLTAPIAPLVADHIRITCEEAAPIDIPATSYDSKNSVTPRTVLTGVNPPVVTTMTASLNGSPLPSSAAIYLPPPSGVPSDNLPGSDIFLTFKGIDSRKSACQYYLKVGAVNSCGKDGATPTGGITFDDWKNKVHMEPYTLNGAKDVSATYINYVDLNLTRNHHSIAYGKDANGQEQTAAYVCNHLGPTDASQAAIDKAIDNATHGRNLVACVAMDYYATPGVNGGKAFTRFLIFSGSGQLLTSVNLDGRTEKFMPGVCVACHGGDKYAGKYPEDGSGNANFGGHFLPYDTGNFHFSTKPGLTEANQESAIYTLNQNVLKAGPTAATAELIAGWYPNNTQVLNKDYVPSSWQAVNLPEVTNYYKNVYARSCRTCHVAFTEHLNFDHYANLALVPAEATRSGLERIDVSSCAGGSMSFIRNYSMPNSLNTMNLYWKSSGSGPTTDQPAMTAAFLTAVYSIFNQQGGCNLSNPLPQ